MTMKWGKNCKSCGLRLDEGSLAFGRRNSNDKWEFLCPSCHTEEYGASVNEEPPSKPKSGLAIVEELDRLGLFDPASQQQRVSALPVERDEFFETCSGCGNMIDPTTCHCGTPMSAHGIGDNHSPVPMGCTCGYAKVGATGKISTPPKPRGPEPYTREWIANNAVWGRI